MIDEDGNLVDKNKENKFKIKDILKDNIIKIKSNSTTITNEKFASTQTPPLPAQSESFPHIIHYDPSKYEKLQETDDLSFYLYSKIKCQSNHKLVYQYFFDKFGGNDLKKQNYFICR